MPFNKWNLLEAALLLLFAASLYLLYVLLLAANSPVQEIENQFNQSSLRGTISIALSKQGEKVKTGDFNFIGQGTIAHGTIFEDFNNAPMLCFSLGEKNSGKGFRGGIEEENEQMLFYSLENPAIRNFTVLCENSNRLIGQIHSGSNDSFKAEYFFDCSCLEEQGKCCAIALGFD